ncbi:paladin-like isoform X2 [Petromyzon marinus]|uniref:Paladin-like isoform X2 n=1 Tax=Petromyzon marinus TaxID=7757 RepID=A0AAJ7X8M3_PETMA|nr:paladin-like isoform X2 [Petromyzon marinus]
MRREARAEREESADTAVRSSSTPTPTLSAPLPSPTLQGPRIMGTTASTGRQAVSVAAQYSSFHGDGPASRHPPSSVAAAARTNSAISTATIISNTSAGGGGGVGGGGCAQLPGNRAKSIITNKVAPVVITFNCKEEFQIHDEKSRAGYITGRIADGHREHYLIQGKYFLVRDQPRGADVLGTVSQRGAPNFRQAQNGLPVYGMGQPSPAGLLSVLQGMCDAGHTELLLVNLRGDPVVFLPRTGPDDDDDFTAFVPRRPGCPLDVPRPPAPPVPPAPPHAGPAAWGHRGGRCRSRGGWAGREVDALELSIRREILDFASLKQNTYYVYEELDATAFPGGGGGGGAATAGAALPCRLSEDDDVRTSEEVFCRPLFTVPGLRYARIPFPVEGAPDEEAFDDFINLIRQSPGLVGHEVATGATVAPAPAFLFTCRSGTGCTTLGMALACLLLGHRLGFPATPRPGDGAAAETPPIPRLHLITSFLDIVPDAQQILDEVDCAVAMCSELCSLSGAVYEDKERLEAVADDRQSQGSGERELALHRLLGSLERCFYLLCFNFYLHEQFRLAFSLPFSVWMRRHPELLRLLARSDVSELWAPVELITAGTRILVADDHVDLDVMSSKREMHVANFRRVPKLPVYGMAQPSSEGLSHVLSYLTGERRAHGAVASVNLRGEVVLEASGNTYTPRERAQPHTAIVLPASNPEQIDEVERELKACVLAAPGWLEAWQDDEKQVKAFRACETPAGVHATLRRSLHPQLRYHRLPLPDGAAPSEQDFDRLLDLFKVTLAEEASAAFLFSCHSGGSRTTTAMAATVLFLWHVNGFPVDTEEEMVSVPDAKYTKGEFEAVLELLRMLPDGPEMKREVDAALDAVSETMTPMHYHLREVIFCTYRKVRMAKTEEERASLCLRSLQRLERYIYLILYNTYLHLEKGSHWDRPFSLWMSQVAARAGVYDLLDRLGFAEFEDPESSPLCRLRHRWRHRYPRTLPPRGEFK